MDGISRMEAENALRANIKQKGENSYYYAHQPRPQVNPSNAIVVEGDGIITGGDPSLAHIHQHSSIAPTVVPIRNYSWADETEKVLVIVNFVTGGGLTQEMVDCQFEPKRVTLSVRVSELEEHRLILRRLSHNVLPEACRVRVKANRVTLTLKKEASSKWFSLVEAGKLGDDWS